MQRRTFLRNAAFTAMAARFLNAEPAPRSKMGIATTSYMMAWKPQDTLEFLDHCHGLGAAGIQSAIHGDPTVIRQRAEQYGMYVEAMVPLPKPGGETAEFEHSLQMAQAAGCVAMRSACSGTRRYEAYKSDTQWQQHVTDSHAALDAARPILDRYKIPLGIENHKDWTAEELSLLMRQYGTEYLGVCVDFGNNLSLLDQPMQTIEALAPFAKCVHLKDMAVAPDPNGFLLSEVLLGDGYLDLPKAISLVRQRNPDIRLSLEMITRDPLKVPCLDDAYWVTFPNRNGKVLADALHFVNTHPPASPLPVVSRDSHEAWLKQENDNVITCLRYGREHLSL